MSRSITGDARWIIQRAIQAVLPDEAVCRALEGRAFPGKVVLVAAGKAAWQMSVPGGASEGRCGGHQIRPRQGAHCRTAVL